MPDILVPTEELSIHQNIIRWNSFSEPLVESSTDFISGNASLLNIPAVRVITDLLVSFLYFIQDCFGALTDC